jgi:sporulation protein YlmC with PRC-barrel domain
MIDATTGTVPDITEGEHRLILASRVEHTPVFNTDGDRIGHIADLSIDRQEGTIVWAIMSFGGFLGIGKRFHPLPWRALQYDPERAAYVVPLSRAELEGAPHYDAEELRQLGGAKFEDFSSVLAGYYEPYYATRWPPMV